ncbi:MAG: TonB-dependent receptor, partial [Pyrinomonadaceae bacterium]|nr:TonB-dependent receptor [Pyrinomonadaceae bacterium]
MAASVLITLISCGTVFSQSSTGSISGTVTDQNNAVVLGATVLGKNTETGFVRSAVTNSSGLYRLTDIPSGPSEITIAAASFRKLERGGITLDVGQNAIVDAVLQPGEIVDSVTVNENASMLNSSTAEVSTRFDSRRLSELPISPNRSVYNVLLSTPGVIQLATGQATFNQVLSFSANGGRTRSNNFMLDGQDMNDPTFTGAEVALNNPDAIQEVSIITNQFRAEYGHNAASIVNVVGKSGTNNYHGSLFWYHNNEYLNACSNLDKVATGAPTGFCNNDAASDARKRAPLRNENQIGFTFGGPLTLPVFGDGGDRYVWKGTDKTFIFGDYQRWSDRSLVSGPTINGAPTAAGRALLQSVVGDRPQVQALLRSVPAGIPNGTFQQFTILGQPPRNVELGDFTGSSQFVFDDHQGSLRLDHRFNEKNFFYARYRFDSQDSSGGGQVTPPGLTTVNESRSSALAIVLNSVLTSRSSNEVRFAWLQFSSRGDAEFPFSKTIPAMTIVGLGMVQSNAGSRALGFSPGLPGFREHDTYQITDAFSYVTGAHSMKFGVELRRTDARLLGILNTRGTLTYSTLSSFVNDSANPATKNFLLAGGESAGFYRWHEFYAFAQDEWRIRDSLTLTLGVRYEYPGDPLSYLRGLNGRILAANGNNPLFKLLGPLPETDANNLMPRIGFNWNPRTGKKGIIGFFTGGDKLVVSGGYARTYDPIFMNIVVNMGASFPFVATPRMPTTNAFLAVRDTTVPDLSQANLFTRFVLSADIRSPATDQISIETQRELTKDLVMKIGYIRTRGTGLLQSIDGNPCLPLPACTRVNPNLGIINLYTNAASSTYDALQASLTKRLSRNFSAGLHYTWSTLIDDVTDVIPASTSEFSRSQNSFDRRADRGRSGYDRPHRLTGNFVYELPFYQHQTGSTGKFFGGWQLNSFFTFQSGAPFTVTLGSDLTGSGNPIRPNLNTNLDLSSMTISEILAAGGANLFRGLSPGQRVGNAGRNILRSDGLNLVDFGIIKNTRLSENVRIQLRADMFNAFNSRNFGIPNGAFNSGANFFNQWATNGGNRRIVLGARLAF